MSGSGSDTSTVSDSITVFGGGMMRVATEEVSRHAAQLRDFADACAHSRMALANVVSLLDLERLTKIDAPISAVNTRSELTSCVEQLGWTSLTARMLSSKLDIAASTYGAAENLSRELAHAAAGAAAYGLGALSRLFGGALAPVAAQLAGGLLGAAAAWLLSPKDRRDAALKELGRLGPVLSDPGLVAVARLSVSSVDEFGAGALLIPWPVLGILGDEALDILGYSTAAGAVAATARGLGVARETAVRVTAVGEPKRVAAPSGVGELVERIPSGEEQVRVDVLEMADGSREYVAYVGGTREGADGEPWDMASNFSALADGSAVDMGSAGSSRAIILALEAAGAQAGDPVNFVGHSQGTVASSEIANTGIYSVRSIVSVGGPIGELTVPEGTRVLALEHTEDIVLAAGGVHRNPGTIVVERQLFAEGEVPTSSLLPAHELARYRETAVLVDGLHDARVVGFREQVTAPISNAVTVESQLYVGTRIVPNGGPGDAPSGGEARGR